MREDTPGLLIGGNRRFLCHAINRRPEVSGPVPPGIPAEPHPKESAGPTVFLMGVTSPEGCSVRRLWRRSTDPFDPISSSMPEFLRLPHQEVLDDHLRPGRDHLRGM